jgi:hypothetical protein|tara:strand:- start:320 stop:433 length:114 start_codon:yes stop_codon:yes gene_type:complete
MKYARKCSITGEGMNEGWEDESEHQYEEINGILIEIQ